MDNARHHGGPTATLDALDHLFGWKAPAHARHLLHIAICVSRPHMIDRPIGQFRRGPLLVCCPDFALQGVTFWARRLQVPAAATLPACRPTVPAASSCFETLTRAISSGPFIFVYELPRRQWRLVTHVLTMPHKRPFTSESARPAQNRRGSRACWLLNKADGGPRPAVSVTGRSLSNCGRAWHGQCQLAGRCSPIGVQ